MKKELDTASDSDAVYAESVDEALRGLRHLVRDAAKQVALEGVYGDEESLQLQSDVGSE